MQLVLEEKIFIVTWHQSKVQSAFAEVSEVWSSWAIFGRDPREV